MTFFDYSENINPVKEFGIRDDEAGKEKLKADVLAKNPCDEIASIPAKELSAFIDYENKEEWNAVVESDCRNDFNFIAVDNNIPYYDAKGNEEKRCDAMIFTDSTVIFIELKDQAKDWFEGAVEQLKSTIAHFSDCNGLESFKFKKAYICNKAHPYFNCQYKDRIQRFFKETGVSLRTEKLIKNVR